MIEFEWPWLLLLLPLPLLVRRLSKPVSVNQAALNVPFIDDFAEPQAAQSLVQQPSRSRLLLGILAWLCLLIAAARPQWLGEPLELPIEGRDIMLAIDLSGSMEEADFILGGRQVDRLTATKAVAGAFVEQRVGDRIGLILFGSQAYLQTPLTFDRQTVTTLMYEAVTRIAGEKTAIGDAIGLAVKRLQGNKGERLLILLSDGENTAGELDPLKAAELAAEDGLKIYTIGIGPDTRNQRGRFFGMNVLSRRAGFDARTLMMIAQKTQGKYFHASNTEELAEVYEEIDQLEPIASDKRVYRPVKALFYWPLSLAMLLVLMIFIMTIVRQHRGAV